jgi:hypothetical protein
MSLYDQIVATYPELKDNDPIFVNVINLTDDSDGDGAYISKWEYDKPIPKGLKLGK